MFSETNLEVTLDPALSMARQSLYRFAAVSLLDPKEGTWAKLAALRHDPLLAEAAMLVRGMPAAVPTAFAPGERPLARPRPARGSSIGFPHDRRIE